MSEVINGDAGRVGFLVKGEYQESETYDFLDVVYYNGSSYVAKKLTTGNKPALNNEYWQILASAGQGGINPDDFALKAIYGDDAISLGRRTGENVGQGSIAYGDGNTASADNSVAFGSKNYAKGKNSFVSGNKNEAIGLNSSSFGSHNVSVDNYCFSEGCGNIVFGYGSHVEGNQNIAGARYFFKIASYDTAAKTFTFDDTFTGFSNAFSALTDGDRLFIQNVNYTGDANIYTVSSKESDGKSVTVNESIPTEHYRVLYATIIKNTGYSCHAEGISNIASGTGAYVCGGYSIANGMYSYAHGHHVQALLDHAYAEGYYTTANGNYSHVEGFHTTSLGNQHAQGHYNDTSKAVGGNSSGTNSGTAFVIGNGTSTTPSNAARIDYNGKLWCKDAYSSTGADYAELFEWEDGNLENEDRRGYFVTVCGKKIKKASVGDYIVGIISGNPSVIGNTDMEWYGQFMRDEFGTFIKETYKETVKEPIVDEEGNVTEEKKEVDVEFYKVNPDYDPDSPYTFRLDRPEWDAVGMLGVLPVRDDGTCEVGKFCKCSDGGIATLAAERGFDTYMVIERVTENIVSVILK